MASWPKVRNEPEATASCDFSMSDRSFLARSSATQERDELKVRSVQLHQEIATCQSGNAKFLVAISYSPKLPITASGVAASNPPSTGITIPEIHRASSLAK